MGRVKAMRKRGAPFIRPAADDRYVKQRAAITVPAHAGERRRGRSRFFPKHTPAGLPTAPWKFAASSGISRYKAARTLLRDRDGRGASRPRAVRSKTLRILADTGTFGSWRGERRRT